MEPEKRPTKRERREQARHERQEREQQQQRQGSQRRVLTVAGALVAAVAIGALIWATRPEPAETGITITAAEAEEAAAAAGCERTEFEFLPQDLAAIHIPEEDAPSPGELYQDLPTTHGPHFGGTEAFGVFDEPVDERLTTHNLEHGTIIAWYDPELLDAADRAALEAWAEERNNGGFGQRGAGLIVSPYHRELDSGQALAFRGWFVAVDCDGFDETAADAVLALHYGSRGEGPEAPRLAPYPGEVLDFEGPVTDDPFGGEVVEVDEPTDEPDDADEPDEADEPDGDDPDADEDEDEGGDGA